MIIGKKSSIFCSDISSSFGSSPNLTAKFGFEINVS